MPNEALRSLLLKAISQLTARRFETSDADEKTKIDETLSKLQDQAGVVDQMMAVQAAEAISEAADELTEVVRSARTGPFDDFAAEMGQVIESIRIAQENTFAQEFGERDFPKTEESLAIEPPITKPPQAVAQPAARPAQASVAPKPAQPSSPPAAAPAGAPGRTPGAPVAQPDELPAVINSTVFADLQAEYTAAWKCCKLRAEKKTEVEAAAQKAKTNRQRYETVAGSFNGMPWQFLAVIHGMECGFRFDRHLHNGDPLSGRTVRVPAGYPKAGNPPYAWEDSARDALRLMKYDQVRDWSLPHMLYLLEKYNGFGYRFKGVRTPYLWSYSNLYERGRYVADRVFDPNAVSKQCGAAMLLRSLL